MLPGKTYKPEDILVIAWRRRWQIIVPFLLVAGGAIRYSQTLPDRYRSETVILIVPQRVPESYVHSTVTSRIEDRLRSINQQIMSRTRLEPIIQTLNLYPGLMKNGLVEDAVARMRLDADVQVVKGDAFRVSFIANEPRTAMKVTQQLASLFIDENLKDREVLAEDTNQFLDSQLDNAKQRLIEHEKKLEEYRKRYAGQLPTQVQSNLQVIQNAQMQIQSINDSIGRDRDRRLMLERQVADSNAILGTVSPGTPGEEKSATANDRPNMPGPAAIALEAAVKELRQLETQFKPEHPDVIHQKRIVADLTQKAQVEALALPQSTLPSSPLPPGTRPEVVRAAQTASQARAEMDSLDRQLTAKDADLVHLHSVVADYQARVEAVPTRESEMVELTRDYDTLQKGYTTLLGKKEEAQVSANLERRQIGEQFKVLDPARLPERPFSPDRTRIDLFGAAIGLGLGLALAAALEYRDTALRTDEEVVASLALPVLALIPVMTTMYDRARVRRNRILVSSAALLILGVAGVMLWTARS